MSSYLPTGYALWFLPQDEVLKKATHVIQSLSTRYSSPQFEPHITMLGVWKGSEDEAIRKTQMAVKDLKPFQVRLSAVGFLDSYFRNLFVHVENSPELSHVYQRTHSVFEINEPAPFLPHLSLFYGKLSNEVKTALAKELEPQFKGAEFTVGSLGLYFINSEIAEWKCVRHFPLG